jgi:hypothetical protein
MLHAMWLGEITIRHRHTTRRFVVLTDVSQEFSLLTREGTHAIVVYVLLLRSTSTLNVRLGLPDTHAIFVTKCQAFILLERLFGLKELRLKCASISDR